MYELLLPVWQGANYERTEGDYSTLLAKSLDYLEVMQRETRPLFVPILKGNRVQKRRMNARSIYDMIKKRTQQAGVKDFFA